MKLKSYRSWKSETRTKSWQCPSGQVAPVTELMGWGWEFIFGLKFKTPMRIGCKSCRVAGNYFSAMCQTLQDHPRLSNKSRILTPVPEKLYCASYYFIFHFHFQFHSTAVIQDHFLSVPLFWGLFWRVRRYKASMKHTSGCSNLRVE